MIRTSLSSRGGREVVLARSCKLVRHHVLPVLRCYVVNAYVTSIQTGPLIVLKIKLL